MDVVLPMTARRVPTTSKRDITVVNRFNRRIPRLLTALFLIFLSMWLFQLVLRPSVAVILHGVSFFFALFAFGYSQDAIRKIVYTMVFWTFSFSLFLNSSFRLQPIDIGIIDPIRAAYIVVVSQIASTFVAVLDRIVPQHKDSAAQKTFKIDRIYSIYYPVLLLSLFSVALDFMSGLPTIITESLKFIIPLPIALRFLIRGPSAMDPVFVSLIVGYAGIAVADNNRTDVLTFVLLTVVLYTMHAERFITLSRVLLAYIVMRLVSVFSAVSIAVRPLRDAPSEMRVEFFERFFSVETLVSLVNPLYIHSATFVYEMRQTGFSQFKSDFYHGTTSSLLDRLTLLPQMDIVTGRMDGHVFDGYRLLQSTLLSALPDFGQAKVLMLGDTIVWDLALRSRDSIGRPMITAQAEAWVIGGYPAVFLSVVAGIAAWALTYRLISRYVPFGSVTIALSTLFLIHGFFSTTLLSQTLAFLRMPLQTLLLIVVVVFAGRLFIRPISAVTKGSFL